ncbi:MAG: hypothetical protein KJ587_11360 [Alphaproteobacteria bacterium]|nr:hypothetical protein [Alphaproteobacteria bacterium]
MTSLGVCAVRRIAGLAIVGHLILPCLCGWSGGAAANEPLGFWQSEDVVVRVVDLPDTAMFKRGSQTHVDLGYHFRADGSGVWVGYVAGGAHESLDAVGLGMTMAAAGLDALPEPPLRPAGILAYIFATAIAVSILAVVGRFVLGRRLAMLRTNRRKNSMLHGDISAPDENTPASVRQAMRKAAEKKRAIDRALKQAKSVEPVAETLPAPAAARRGIQAAALPSMKFGRRGW